MANIMSQGLTMPSIFPRAEYAEDQQYPYSILTVHCLHRGFNAGAILGIAPPTARSVFTTLLSRPHPASPLSYTSRVLSSTAVGTIAGTALTGIGMTTRMWGREEVEWQDRSWRILANKGQNREDAFSLGGIVIGAAASAWRTMGREVMGAAVRVPRWRMVVGSAGVGSVVGTVLHVVTSSFGEGEGQRGVETLEKKVEAGAGPLKPE